MSCTDAHCVTCSDEAIEMSVVEIDDAQGPPDVGCGRFITGHQGGAFPRTCVAPGGLGRIERD